jgi:hypothetical protein
VRQVDDDDTNELGIVLGTNDVSFLGTVPASKPAGGDVVIECLAAIKVGQCCHHVSRSVFRQAAPQTPIEAVMEFAAYGCRVFDRNSNEVSAR